MNQGKSCLSIIIPAYNEEECIGQVIKKIKTLSEDYEIIVVDDGSTDRTGEVAGKEGARVITHPYNKGNGAAVKTGIKITSSEWVMIVDADGQHNPEDISSLIKHLDVYDLVVGVRTKESEGALVRDLGNWCLKKVASYLVDRKIPDLTSGFRAFKKERIEEFIHLCPNGFSFPTTSTLAFLMAGYNVKFVPSKMVKRYKGTKSKIKLWRDGLKFFNIIIRIIAMFHPMKIFFPLSVSFALIGIGYMINAIYCQMRLIIPPGAVVLLISSVMSFFFGVVLEQISYLRLHLKR